MTEHIHPGTHLDADQLAAFAEGALNERERQQSLMHLTECSECRSIVFTAQEALPVPELIANERPKSFWRSLTPLAYACAALVCIAVGFFALRRGHTPASPPDSSVAQVSVPPALNDVRPAAQLRDTTRKTPAAEPHAEHPTTNAKSQSTAPVVGEQKAVNVSSSAPQPAAGSAPPPAVQDAQTQNQVVASARSMAPAQPVNNASAQPLPFTAGTVGGPLKQVEGTTGALARGEANEVAIPAPDGPLTIRIEHGQNAVASLAEVTGVVTDASGALISGATVTLRQKADAAPRAVQTDRTGRFEIAAVPAGKYDLQITAPGFQEVKSELDLGASDVALLTSQLPIGSVTETVDVAAAAPALETESASVTTALVLPGRQPVAATVSQGKRVLALDPAGAVFLSTSNGKHWKKVKPQWHGKIVKLDAAVGSDGFQVTTDAGSVWISLDGKSWHRR